MGRPPRALSIWRISFPAKNRECNPKPVSRSKIVRIILGSASPRRRELLAGLDVDFTVDTQNSFVESFEPGTKPEDVPVLMARGKSLGFHRALEPDELLITSDTVVICPDAQAIGKPHSREEAVQMLRRLSGRTHTVVTAVCFRTADHPADRTADHPADHPADRTADHPASHPSAPAADPATGPIYTVTDSTKVTFEPLTPEEIDYYVDKYKPYDKAGAYGVQEWIGYVAVSHIEGSFYNVMGFPVHKVWKALKDKFF